MISQAVAEGEEQGEASVLVVVKSPTKSARGEDGRAENDAPRLRDRFKASSTPVPIAISRACFLPTKSRR